MDKLRKRFESKVYYSIDGCWLWTDCVNNKGYGRISVKGNPQLASRVSYKIYKGDPGNLFVLHRCDNPLCVNPDHLFLGTNMDNVKDKMSKNRHPIGCDAGRSILTTEQVLLIRSLRKTYSIRKVSKLINVKPGTVHYVSSGRGYKNIT